MYLTVCKPNNRVSLLNNNLDRWFEDFFNGGSVFAPDTGWVPRADVQERDDSYQVQFDLPGLDKKDVKVKFEENTLTVSGERKAETSAEEQNFRRIERHYGGFTRSIRLPKNVNANKINANFKNGVLEITLPKSEEVKPKEIEISVN